MLGRRRRRRARRDARRPTTSITLAHDGKRLLGGRTADNAFQFTMHSPVSPRVRRQRVKAVQRRSRGARLFPTAPDRPSGHALRSPSRPTRRQSRPFGSSSLRQRSGDGSASPSRRRTLAAGTAVSFSAVRWSVEAPSRCRHATVSDTKSPARRILRLGPSAPASPGVIGPSSSPYSPTDSTGPFWNLRR